MICLDRATDDREQSPVVDVGADQQIHIGGGPSARSEPADARNDVPIDDRLPRQRAGHRFGTPALRVGVREKISPQLSLGRKHAINRHPRDRLPGGLDAERDRRGSRPIRSAVAAATT